MGYLLTFHAPETIATKNLTETACSRPLRDASSQYSIMNIVSGVITVIVATGRLLFRRFFTGKGKLGPDDWIISVVIIIGIAGIVVNQVGLVGHGIGKDIWTLPAIELPAFAMYFFIMEVIYLIEMPLIKLSLSLFYLYVFPGTTIRRLLIGTAIFNVIFGVAFVITAMVQCIPLNYYWAQYYDYPPEGTCVDLNKFAWANAGMSLAVDLWMIILPLAQVRRLNLHWKKKIGVIFMFVMGAFVSVVSLLRLKSVIFFANLINPTWDQWNVAWWSTMEVNIGIICTCLPTVRLMLKRMFPRIFSIGDGRSIAGLSQAGGAPPRGAETPASSMELSTTTLAMDGRSDEKPFENV
ncbi:extracellular membrane, 8-cysteine region, cfem [Trichoderma arundinaceum]|uniref:Extracellular membrane, 8-cysteine region, cfem n=1 Tax=Trichoderma arundinaceum TaxID=490622 RepID=A0A395NUB1_TRIAR|nr:extracellular membrane, 8-cysteine region, cfem [Trichoderma arundinaceum]